MKATILPTFIEGAITAPASKSAMQRACAAALIRKGKSILSNPGISADDKAAVEIIKQLGAECHLQNEKLVIESNGINPISNAIHCGESGLSVRMFTSIAALSEQKITITGSGSLLKRPLSFFDEILPELAVVSTSQKGFLPLTIQGPLQPKNIQIDGSLSSQFLTGLLFAFSAAAAKNVTITVHNLNSKPYIDLTLSVLQRFGFKTPINNNFESFYFNNQDQPATNETIHYTVEGDWSGAAFLLVAGAVNGNIKIRGVDLSSSQADKAILQALTSAGAVMSIKENQISIAKSNLKAFHFNATDCPDLFPPLVTLAAYCEGTTTLQGVNRLQHKESNRALTLQQEFRKMGVTILLQDDVMLIEGGANVQGADVFSHHDHRIAMACAVAALKAKGEMNILEAEAIDKSYPNFYMHLQQLGTAISLTDNK